MGKQKPGTMIYWEMFDVLERMKPEKALSALTAIRQYAQYGQEPAFDNDDTLAVIWPIFAQKIAADNERYIQKCKKATEAINARWGKPNDTGVYERIPAIPTTTETKTSSPPSSASKTMTEGNILKYARDCGFDTDIGTVHGIMKLASQYGNDRVFQALDRCVEYGKTSIAYLTTVLQNF